ncbi:MAG: HepT-like ribonuclease domain-containing protein [Chloroflexota bacterium]
MIEAADAALQFARGRDRAALDTDGLLEAGLVQKVVIIGEAAAGLSEQFRRGHPRLPWADIIGMRNVIVHSYWRVDHDELWRTVTDDLPTVLGELRPLFAQIDASDDPSVQTRRSDEQ